MPISEGPNIHVRLLGQISVQVGMVDVRSFRSNRVPALLGFLITQPGPHLRQAVAQTLWPNATEAVCRHNLRQTLLYLRSILGDLGDRAISASRSHLGLLPGILASDVDLLLETERYQGEEAKIRACEDAVRHAIGPFLPGIDDDWIRNERAFLSQTYLRALLFLADVEMEHSPAKALEYAERAVNEEPLMDGARARKISALVRLGEGVAAQLEFESFAELLDNELGITPSDIVRDALNEPAAVSRSRFVADRPNVKSDIAFALDTLGLGDRPNLAVELAIATTPHWIAVGTPSFGIERLREAIDRCGDRLDEATRCSAMVSIAELSLSKGDHESVERIVMDLRRRSGGLPDRVHVKALSLIAWVHLSRFDGTAALTKAKAAIAICETLGDSSIELDALRLASTAALAAMDFAQASAYAEKVIEVAKRLGQKMPMIEGIRIKAQALEALGEVNEAEENAHLTQHFLEGVQSLRATTSRMHVARLLEDLGRLDEAEAGYRRAIREFQEFDCKYVEAIALTYLGDLVYATNRPREAVSIHSRALTIRRELHQALGTATSLRGLGRVYCDLGELHAAREALTEAANLYLNEDAIPGYASVLLALAQVEEKSDRPALAYRLAKRARKLLAGMTIHEKKQNGPSGLHAIADADGLIERCK